MNVFDVLSIVVALLGVTLIVYIFGFQQSLENRLVQLLMLKIVFAYYMLNYFVRFLYTFEPGNFFRQTRFEWILLLLLVIEALSSSIFNFPLGKNLVGALGLGENTHVYELLLLFFLLALLIFQIAKASTFLDKITIEPSSLFILSFAILILAGAGLLMLPEMTTDRMGTPFLSALFTSTSASCVTGLIVVDTATYFSLKGKIIIIFLMQLGGLSIISFATFFASFFTKGLGVKHTTLMADYYSSDSILTAKSLLRQIVVLSFIIEGAGVIILFIQFGNYVEFKSFWSQLFCAVFHSVSAFNNAGFSTFTNNLYEECIRQSYDLHLTIATLIFFGSLGFSTIQDVFSYSSIKERSKLKWKKIKLASAISLYSSFWLIGLGALGFWFFENHHTLEGLSNVGKVVSSIFQAVTPRTAGFNSVDYNLLSNTTIILTIFLMFIGASSGSTGGGIKTSTFTLLFVSAWATIRGKKNIELMHYSIAWDLLNKAFTILLFSGTFCLASWLALVYFEPHIDPIKLIFEEVSAFCTVGLSTGITAGLSTVSKTVLIVSMFVGRVGTLTLAFALSARTDSTRYKYPTAHFMVG